MASHYYGINIGGGMDASAVTVGTSTGSKDVELVLLDGAGLTKLKVVQAVEAIMARIVENDAPTA